MMNMGHCRFENTNMALQECIDAIDENRVYTGGEDSEAKELITKFLEFCEENGLIDDFDADEVINLIDMSTEEDDEDEE